MCVANHNLNRLLDKPCNHSRKPVKFTDNYLNINLYRHLNTKYKVFSFSEFGAHFIYAVLKYMDQPDCEKLLHYMAI